MQMRAIAIVVFLVLTGGGLAMHFRQQSVKDSAPAGTVFDEEEIPVPPKSGPFAKFVVLDNPVHNFGVMELHQNGEHEFRVRNEGQASLKMVALVRDQTCQCTIGSLGKDGLKPGEETTVKLKWTIKQPVTVFEHSASIRSDDPNNPVTKFRVRGLVGNRLVLKPSNEIQLGLLSEKEPTVRTLLLYSEVVDAFEVTKFEPSNPLIEAVATPMTAEQLKLASHDPHAEDSHKMMEKMKADQEQSAPEETRKNLPVSQHDHDHPPDDLAGKTPDAKCGYELKVTLQPGFPIGKMRETLLIHTNVRNGPQADAPVSPPLHVSLTGMRSGPVQILQGTPGTLWSPEEGILRLGRFPAKDGKKARLMIFVKKFDADLEIKDAKLDPPLLKYEFKKDASFNAPGRDKYELHLEVPAGGAPLTLGGGANRSGSIILETNHPEAKIIKIELQFTSH